MQLLLVGVAVVLGASGCRPSGAERDGGPNRAAGDAGFFPAPFPSGSPCALLTVADVQTILPSSRAGRYLDPLGADAAHPTWTVGCQWDSGAGYVVLGIIGYTTADSLAIGGVIPNGGAGSMVVSGVGRRAAYVDDPGQFRQFLETTLGSYSIGLTAYSVVPDVSEAALEPLVLKIIREIENGFDT